jgi:L-alanine-DL-glutamate epimerase-like enolase superfamily enzyme
MNLTFAPLDLTLHEPFTIFRGTQHTAENVTVALTHDGINGIGEAAPSEHYGELRGTVIAFLEGLARLIPTGSPISHQELHELMDRTARLNPAAKAAVDIALFDLLGKQLGAPIYRLLGLDPTRTPLNSFTIGMSTPEDMARKARESAHYPILKIKVGSPNDHHNLEAIRTERPDAILRVDANEAWTPKEAAQRIEELSAFDLQLVEQPVNARDLEGLDYVRRAVSLPIMVDESCVVPEDVPMVEPYVDGIVIKLMKCGGIAPALEMIHLARAHHLRIMMGCMVESSIAITAAAHLTPLIDYADLDGNLLVDDDPYRGVIVEAGKLVLPDGPGLGLLPAS